MIADLKAVEVEYARGLALGPVMVCLLYTILLQPLQADTGQQPRRLLR